MSVSEPPCHQPPTGTTTSSMPPRRSVISPAERLRAVEGRVVVRGQVQERRDDRGRRAAAQLRSALIGAGGHDDVGAGNEEGADDAFADAPRTAGNENAATGEVVAEELSNMSTPWLDQCWSDQR